MLLRAPQRFCIFVLTCLAVLLAPTTNVAVGQHGISLDTDSLTQTVLIHPVIDADASRFSLVMSEHEYDPGLRLGDRLGSDFKVQKLGEDGVPRSYAPGTDGTKNEDWYGWRREVLAPFGATVTRVQHPDTTNVPGTMNREAKPGLIFFENEEGVIVVYAHAREISVEEGQRVETGDVVAKVGNNGNSRAPHIHVGAWKDETPLQIQVYLYAEQHFGASTTD
ncbi:MAG: peptidoglycan DD-metalloendopeptidase family protein [Bacteroidetes bacterium]|jgi:hypothetical protein|nr:peptidoglycan DD-metalloendopeptidase family protein [Bacteroidota bacterium]